MDAYFNTDERISTYDKAEPINVKYNLDLLASVGITPASMAGKRVLDVGCGFGMLLNELHKAGAFCYGTDISEYAIKICKGRYPEIATWEADITNIPIFDIKEKFDLIMCFGVLGIAPIKDHPVFMKQVFDALKDTGVLFATAPNRSRPAFMGKKKNCYDNARDVGVWKALLVMNNLQGEVYPVLRIPKSERFGRNIFLKLGLGDPIVIVARKQCEHF